MVSLQQRRRRGNDTCNALSSNEKHSNANDASSTASCSTDLDSSTFSVSNICSRDSIQSTSVSYNERVRTLDQNEFFSDVMTAPSCDEVVFVHFYVEGSHVSEAIDHQIRKESKNHPLSKFVRIEASTAPFVARRLGSNFDRPSMVALKDGKLINRITDFESDDCSEIKMWLDSVELLKFFQR